MAIIPATNIKDSRKKNKLILFARQNGCKAIFVEMYNGMGIECATRQQERLIKAKINELAD